MTDTQRQVCKKRGRRVTKALLVKSVLAASLIAFDSIGDPGVASPPLNKVEAQMSSAEKEAAWRAVQICQGAILLTLHDPKSAEFPTVSKSFRALERGAYRVQVQVRARNGFNALRLTTMECRVDAATGKLRSIREIR